MSARSDAATMAVEKGCDWFCDLIDSDGRVAGDTGNIGLYAKAPASLAVNGRCTEAYRTLDILDRYLLDADGSLGPSLEGSRPFNTYDRGWLAWGATIADRPDIAWHLGRDISAHQDWRTGGFWDTTTARAEQGGLQGAMTAGMAALGLLVTGRIESARRAAEFLDELFLDQPEPELGFYAYRELPADWAPGDGDVRGPIHRGRSSVHFVDFAGRGQRPARFGPAVGALVRLHRLTGESRYLDTAKRYVELFLRGPDEIFLCVEGHKYVWALIELAAVTGEQRYRDACGRLVDYLVGAQQDDGRWLAESSASGGEQSLELVVNTTCNVLVGLGYFRNWGGV